jgi:hypothetical protein
MLIMVVGKAVSECGKERPSCRNWGKGIRGPAPNAQHKKPSAALASISSHCRPATHGS